MRKDRSKTETKDVTAGEQLPPEVRVFVMAFRGELATCHGEGSAR